MITATRGCIGLASIGFVLAVAAHSARLTASQDRVASSAPSASPHRAVLNRYCVTCHNERLKTAGLMLDQIDVDMVRTDEAAAVLEKVVRKLRTGAMPPPGAPRPDQSAYDLLASHLETELDRFATAHPNPGRTATLHRLNRAEYANAVRDLLALDIDAIDIASLLPADDSGYGFDNIADVLAVSPVLLERYMSAAARVARLAVGIAPARPDLTTYEVSKFLKQDVSVSEDLPFGSRGGAAVRHYFPVDGEYVVRARLKRSYDGQRILGLSEPTPIEFRVDGIKVGEFILESLRGAGSDTGPEPDARLEVRAPVQAGTHVIGVTFPQETWAPEKDSLREFGYVGVGLRFDDVDEPALGSVSILGPYNARGPGDTPSRRRIFVCTPSATGNHERCARTILSTVARRAYRRPVTDVDIEPLLKVYGVGQKAAGFDAGIEIALQRLLVSPEFVFRIERDPPGVIRDAVYRISDLEFASRLSFFLWSSIPDDELLTLAAADKLRDPKVLEQQVRRMLADSRSSALVANFAGQWLYLRNVPSALPDIGEYPDFDENLRDAFERETELFLEAMLREDRSVLDLLRADFTFVNERLARHYGIPGIYGGHFRRVTVKDANRRGLLGHGSILMVTSYSNRTSPTIRGKWVLENLLGAPPPPPPPNVPALMDRNETGRILSMREQMEKHRANAACAVCHKNMDPIGFALENFDAIGTWRDMSGADNRPVDASGELPDGTKFNGPAELRDVLLKKPERFANTVAEKLLTYGLGRGIEHYDAPAIRAILRGVSATLALPLLDGMVPALASAQSRPKSPTRLSFIYVPNGIIMERWTPAATGARFEFTQILSPLAPFRENLLVLSGLVANGARALAGEGAGEHARASATFLSGVHPKKTEGTDLRAGITVDQIVAKRLGAETQLASLEVALDSNDIVGTCDTGYSCAYSNTLCWRSETTPIPMENQPRAVFERLFGDSDTTDASERRARIRRRRSILDSLVEDAARLITGLGPSDRAKLTEYLDALRDVERRIQVAEEQSARELPAFERPVGSPAKFTEHCKLMMDLQVLAYQTDLTRVITFMIGREQNTRVYDELGFSDAFHPLSHHQNDPAKIAKVIEINMLHTRMLAYFLEKLRSTRDGDGSLLDHSIIVYGSAISDGNLHLHDNLPMLVAGGGSGHLKGGRHLRYRNETPTTNLYLTLLDRMGIPLEKFGDSTGQLDLLSVA